MYRLITFFAIIYLVHAGSPITAPLVVDPSNPIWFKDSASGKGVYLGGHESFFDMQDHQFDDQFTYNHQSTMDFNWYIGWLNDHNLNYIRDWIVWSAGCIPDCQQNSMYCYPPIYKRNGTTNALDNRPKFYLYEFADDFFARLKDRVGKLEQNGVYISIMLFEVYSFINFLNDPYPNTEWGGNYFNGDNNQEGIDCDPYNEQIGIEFFYSQPGDQIRQIQELWVRAVVDALKEYNNVIYEIANELGNYQFQYDMINYIQSLESRPGYKKHPIYMSPGGRVHHGNWNSMPWDQCVNSDADMFALSSNFPNCKYYWSCDPNNYGKPGMWEGDHMWPDDYQHYTWIWTAFTLGYHFSLYDHPFEQPDEETAEWEAMRKNIGQANRFAASFKDLSAMYPHPELSSVQSCLAAPGSEYIVYQSNPGQSFTLNMVGGTYNYEWWNPDTCKIGLTGSVDLHDGDNNFKAPWDNVEGTLHLYR